MSVAERQLSLDVRGVRLLQVDRAAVGMILALVATQLLVFRFGVVPTISGVTSAASVGGSVADSQIQQGATITPLTVVGVVVEVAVLLGLWKAYQRLSERWQERIRWVLAGMVALFAAVVAVDTAGFLWGTVWWSLAMTLSYVVSETDYYWMVFNAAAVMLAGLIALVIALLLPPWQVVLLFVGLLVWDIVAVDLSDLMLGLVRVHSEFRVPSFVVIPSSVQFDMDRVFDALRGEDSADGLDDGVSIIGGGDLGIPTALPAALAISSETVLSAPVVGGLAATVAGMVILRARVDQRDRTTPGLPILCGLTILGVGAGMVVAPLLGGGL
jgi:presenilin-like A22 family membrane protease